MVSKIIHVLVARVYTIESEEINRIKGPEIRNIRLKYWNLLHQTFLDEYKIPDDMFGKELDKIKAAEIKELDEYRQHNNKG